MDIDDLNFDVFHDHRHYSTKGGIFHGLDPLCCGLFGGHSVLWRLRFRLLIPVANVVPWHSLYIAISVSSFVTVMVNKSVVTSWTCRLSLSFELSHWGTPLGHNKLLHCACVYGGVRICESYVVSHLNGTELCCAPLTCIVPQQPVLCTMVHKGDITF